MALPLDDGPIILSPMLGEWEQYPPGSELWAKSVSMHIQRDYWHIQRDGSVAPLIRVLRVALTAEKPPWEVWPAEAKGNPEAWVKLITGDDWNTISALLRHGDPEAWREISDALARWEVEHRTEKEAAAQKNRDGKGRFLHLDVSHPDGRDHVSARGLQRRLYKRASAGDEQAAALVEQLAAGSISVNAAAIAAGMRPRYLRVPDDDPAKAAASLLNRKGAEWAAALAARLTELLTEEAP